MENQKTEAEAVAALTQKPFVEIINNIPHLLMPASNGGWERYELGNLLPAPLRKSGLVSIHDADSFIAIARKHGSLADSTIYVDTDYAKNKVRAVAVFNDHGDKAGWRDHRADFTPRMTEEWSRWNSKNKQLFGQVELAHFLEENISDIAGGDGLPTGSDVLTFVSNLEETRKVKYGSSVNLQNGMVQIEFVEDSEKAQKGKLEMFREFGIGIAPFFGGSPYKVKAFLRYRIDRNTGEIKFWYELQRADKVLEDACKEVIGKIKDETGIPVIFGIA